MNEQGGELIHSQLSLMVGPVAIVGKTSRVGTIAENHIRDSW
jgi:hypothetical protein